VKLLLDTHIALWAAKGSDMLPAKAAELISDPTNEIWISAIVPWEIAIKHAIGKLDISGWQALRAFKDCGYKILSVNEDHANSLSMLPTYDDHKDPFDRMMIAQAALEEAALVSADAKLIRFAPYVLPV
jgi:PIN domain nuclease of toxin-antitoxin system